MNRRYVCLEVWNIDGFLKSSFAKLDLHALKETVKISEKIKKSFHSFEIRSLLKPGGVTKWCPPFWTFKLTLKPQTQKLIHTNLQLRWITSIFYLGNPPPWERCATRIYTRCSVFFWGGILNCPPHPQTKQKNKQLLEISMALFFSLKHQSHYFLGKVKMNNWFCTIPLVLQKPFFLSVCWAGFFKGSI